jgi:RNA polymerase sigma-70 factor (ECF subfamily)
VFPLPRRRRSGRTELPALDRQLRELIDEHAAAVHQLALGILRDRGLAEDVVQETMIRAWRGLDDFRGESPTRTWVLRSAHNVAIDTLRRRRDVVVAPDDMPGMDGLAAPAADPAQLSQGRSDVVTLRGALAELDQLSRSIVVLREVEGLSYQEIAETLEISTAQVKTRLLRARRTLQAAVRTTEAT